MNLALFKQRAFTIGNLISLISLSGNVGFGFVFTVYMQIGLGFSPLHAGLTFAPSAVGTFIALVLSPRLLVKLGNRVLSLGYCIGALGLFAVLVVVLCSGTALSSLVLAPVLLILGFGQGLGIAPLVGEIISQVHPQDAGTASGMVTTIFQIANALGVAVVGLVFFTILGLSQGAGSHAMQYVLAFSWTLPFTAVLALISCGLVYLLPRTEARDH